MSVVTTRMKMQCASRTAYPTAPGAVENVKLTFTACYDNTIPEDRQFSKYTPSAEFTVWVNGPAAERFKLGEFYYFDVTSVVAAS